MCMAWTPKCPKNQYHISLANADSKTSIEQCTHSAPSDREEVLVLDFCNLLDQCFFSELFRRCFLSRVERAPGNPH